MSNVEDAVARLEALVEQQAAQLAALSQRATDPELLAQARRGNEAALDAPLTSYPEGSRPMDYRPKKIRDREKAIAKMRALARARGGIWEMDPRVPRIYGHKPGDGDLVQACEYLGEDEFRPTCQRTCWTPESETRFLHALGLKDLAAGELTPLTPPDPKNDKSAILELVGLLRGNATPADVTGHYPERLPTREEVGTAQGAARARR